MTLNILEEVLIKGTKITKAKMQKYQEDLRRLPLMMKAQYEEIEKKRVEIIKYFNENNTIPTNYADTIVINFENDIELDNFFNFCFCFIYKNLLPLQKIRLLRKTNER